MPQGESGAIPLQVRRLIEGALEEDGVTRDLTTEALVLERAAGDVRRGFLPGGVVGGERHAGLGGVDGMDLLDRREQRERGERKQQLEVAAGGSPRAVSQGDLKTVVAARDLKLIIPIALAVITLILAILLQAIVAPLVVQDRPELPATSMLSLLLPWRLLVPVAA